MKGYQLTVWVDIEVEDEADPVMTLSKALKNPAVNDILKASGVTGWEINTDMEEPE